VQGVISAIQVSYYPTGAQVMTLVLPLGFFIVVMAGFYLVFTTPHTVPGHREGMVVAKPEAPGAAAAAPIAAAAGFPTATSAGGPEPLADRATPPVVGAAAKDDAAEPEDDGSGSAAGSEESE
jgi:hypothetical protein